RPESGGLYPPLVLAFAAGSGPLLYAREVIVIAVMPFPHRVDERTVRLAVDKKLLRDPGESLQCDVATAIGCAVADPDGLAFARWLAALQPHVADFGYRAAGDPRKATIAQDGRFQRELRREAAAHLRLRRRFAGLVVQNCVASVGAPLDTVGARRENEFGFAERDRMFS